MTARRQHRMFDPAIPNLASDREAWIDDALCAQTDPDSFHPEKGGSAVHAKRTCAACPVRVECATFAMQLEGDASHSVRMGVYGGLSPRERARLARSGWRAGDPVPMGVTGNGRFQGAA